MVAEGVTLSQRARGDRAPTSRGCASSPCSSIRSRCSWARSRSAASCSKAPTSWSSSNEVGDANLDMLPPPDGSGPHRRREPFAQAAHRPAFPWIGTIEVRDSVADHRRRGRAVRRSCSRCPTPPSSRRRPTSRCRSTARSRRPQATPLELTGTAGSFDGWMRGLPGNIDVQGGFGGGKIAIKGGVGVKGTTLQINSRGPGRLGVRPLYPPAGAGRRPLCAERQGRAPSAAPSRSRCTTLKVGSSELTGEALFRVDRKGTPTITVNADVSRLDLGDLRAAPAAAPRPAPPQPAQPRLRADACRSRRAGSAARPCR